MARFAAVSAPSTLPPIPPAPSADPKSKEEKRFARADKDENGRITLAELGEPRRKAYAKLDVKLSFEDGRSRQSANPRPPTPIEQGAASGRLCDDNSKAKAKLACGCA